MRAEHVGSDEVRRVPDAPVDVGLRRRVDHPIRAPNQPQDRLRVGDVLEHVGENDVVEGRGGEGEPDAAQVALHHLVEPASPLGGRLGVCLDARHVGGPRRFQGCSEDPGRTSHVEEPMAGGGDDGLHVRPWIPVVFPGQRRLARTNARRESQE